MMLKAIKTTKIFQVLLLVVLSFMNMSGYADNFQTPKLNNTKVVLGKNVLEALKQFNPNFKPLNAKYFSKTSFEFSNQVPMAVVSDFNEDGYNDVALYGVDSKAKEVVIYMVISIEGTYKVFVVEKKPVDKNTFFRNPDYLVEGRIEDQKRDALSVESYDSGVGTQAVYYFSKTEQRVLRFQKYKKWRD